MSSQRKVGDLRRELANIKANWSVNPQLKDQDYLPKYPTGGEIPPQPSPNQLVTKPKLDQILSTPVANPFLMLRRAELGYVQSAAVREMTPNASGATQPAATPAMRGRPAMVDWRNRWGWNWVTSVQSQGCQDCWAFASAALIESMVRIEHAVWSKRAEVEMRKGVGKTCADYGNCTEALNWARDNGLADPDCSPYNSNNNPNVPTADRNGRTVKIPDHHRIPNDANMSSVKNWIDGVGPVASWLKIYDDFGAVGTGIYHTTPNSHWNGHDAHYVLIVGYDDTNSCWICKNSWGTGFGDQGFFRIGYGQSGIDDVAKYGLQGTNPDPWTKRRLHNGNIIESGNGAAHRNFEMLATANGSQLRHWWRQGGEGGDFGWHQGATFGNDAAVCPTLTGTTYNRNFESVHLTTGGRLHHWYYNQSSNQWTDGGIFGPTDAWGVPAFIQGNFNAPGNFEVVVRTRDGKLNHWWRQNGPPWTWHDGGRFGSNIAYSGASLVQSRYGNNRNLELVAVNNSGQMQHFWRDGSFVWHAGATFGQVSGPPCMIEGQYGAHDENAVGNFELCVAAGGRVQHWWRNNQGDMAWRQSATFGHDVMAVAGLVEGSFGFNLEVVVLRTDRKLQHYWRDGGGWHEGVIIGQA